MVFMVIFLTNLFPKYTPTKAESVATKIKFQFKLSLTFEMLVKYTDIRLTSIIQAIMTPVAINASLDKPTLVKNALRNAP